MNVVQAVFGVFHHFELAHQLRRRGHLQRLYSTWPWARLKREGLPHSFVKTFPLLHTAHYLLGRSGHASPQLLAQLGAWTSRSFDRYTQFQLPRDSGGFPDAFIAISGAGLLTGAEVQRQGGIFICDRGSTHQRFQEQVVHAEYKRWGVPLPFTPAHLVAREEAIYAQADAITVPSTVARRSFIQMGVPAAKVHVIPYGVRLDKFTPVKFTPVKFTPANAPPSPAAFHLLFAGGVSLRKGVPYLLQAFAALRHPNKSLTVVGHIADEMRTLLPRLPTEDVTFTGSLPQPELARIMSRSHALVLPSIEEGLALVQGQAMASGCPVIATAAAGAEDLFTDGTNSAIPQPGFIIPATPENLADPTAALTLRLQQLADDPTLQAAMRLAALERVQQLGGWDHYGDLWESLLHSLIQRP